MSVILGIKESIIERTGVHNEECSLCRDHSIQYHIFRNYFHILSIPFFPVGQKYLRIYCSKCRSYIEATSSNTEGRGYLSIQQTPVFYYSGLFLSLFFLAFIFFNIYYVSKYEKHTNVMSKKVIHLNNSGGTDVNPDVYSTPEIGDVYFCQDNNTGQVIYYFMKVVRFEGDDVYLYKGAVEYSSPADKFASNDYFIEDEIVLSKSQVINMQYNGSILSVERDYPESNGYGRIHKETDYEREMRYSKYRTTK